jgi:peptidoglycan-N-acetylglucosamine deacetylase
MERQSQLQSALWDALTLRPDVGAVAYTLGTAYKAMGDTVQAKNWLLRAAAASPNYRDTRAQLAAAGGILAPQEAIWGGLRTEKVVALTFDDGPKPGMTEPLLEILTQEQVPATFFVIGRHVTAYPDLTRQIVNAGMELANHSYTHPNLTKIGETAIAREIMQTQNAIFQVTGKLPRFVRPPGGNWSNQVAKVCRDWGMIPCMWTVDVYGSEVIGAQSVADAILMQTRPGSVILMHNGKLSTLQALPTVIKELKNVVTVSQLWKRCTDGSAKRVPSSGRQHCKPRT